MGVGASYGIPNVFYLQLAEENEEEDISKECKVKVKTRSVINTFKRPEVYKPFILLTVILMLTDLSGFVVMANFSSDLIKDYGYGEATFVDTLTLVSIIQISRIPSSFLAMGVLGKFRKRPVYLIAAFSLLLLVPQPFHPLVRRFL